MREITIRNGGKTASVSIDLMPGRKRHGLYLKEALPDGTITFEALAYFVSEEKSQRFEEWLMFALGPGVE